MTEQSKTQSQILASMTEIVAGDKGKGPKYIAEHPEEFGFAWGEGAIGKGVGKDYVELKGDCPHIENPPELLLTFVKSFGAALVSKGLNGTSIKVQCDRVNRDTVDKNMAVKASELKEKIVSSILLGVITRTFSAPVTKYVVAGQVFTNQADADKFTANAEKIRQLEAAGAFLAMAAENGIDMTVARSMAKAQYPLAFVENETESK
jgi:hypothetical protein